MPAIKTRNSADEIIHLIHDKSLKVRHWSDLQPLIERACKAKVVLLGEASHGTHEYYTWRSYITQQLITHHGFQFIAVEGDWPDCYKINEFIKGNSSEGKPVDALHSFQRWPTWMWANWEIAALMERLSEHNQTQQDKNKIGFYGLDVYSLWDSLDAIINYLKEHHPSALEEAQKAIRCFEPYKSDDGTSYAYATQLVPDLCKDEVIGLLKEMQHKIQQEGNYSEMLFNAEQNALIAVNAENYYRAMIKGGPQSWNIRDSHMAETLNRLLDFHGPEAKAIVWEHNTHIGDSRATDMVEEGMYNLGELARTAYGDEEVFLVGFGSYQGSVIASSSWGNTMQTMSVPEAKEDSWEYYLHEAGAQNKLLFMDDFKNSRLSEQRLGHRAIGVVYRPAYEQYGNYVASLLPKRYDAFVYIDETKAVHALHQPAIGHKMPDTYPFGF
jgi:erythromycin esterase